MKVIIAGSRSFKDYNRLKTTCDQLLLDWGITHIICGMARGADMLGMLWAVSSKIPVMKFPADWDSYGNGAGYIRNTEMGKAADACILFWNGTSLGTGHMLKIMKELGKPVVVVRFDSTGISSEPEGQGDIK